MPSKNELISYAMDSASYLIGKFDKIDRIILHGSIARGDFDEESDIDLFIDSNEKNVKKINKILEDYYKTNKFKEWKLKGIENPISIITGKLDSEEWKDLKRSIINNGIILFGEYTANTEKINSYTLISFDNIKPDKKRIAIYRKIFGFKVGKKEYPGLVQKLNTKKIGKGTILVPSQYVKEFLGYLKSKKVTPKLYDLWSDIIIWSRG